MAYNLGFISDSDVLNHVTEIVKKYKQSLSIDLKDFNSNLIDPILLKMTATNLLILSKRQLKTLK